MRRRFLAGTAWAVLLLQSGPVLAQSSLDTLEDELKEAKHQHEEVTTLVMTNFFTQVDAAMADSEAALALYKKAGGSMPPLMPVITQHAVETATEKEVRLAADQANLSRLGAALQMHCGMMHYAALFVVQPEQKSLQGEWVAWLNSAAQAYPQLSAPVVEASSTDPASPPPPTRKGKRNQEGAPAASRATYYPDDLKGTSMRDSVIGKFLGFKAWADKDPGGWSVRDVPKLYRTNVLDVSRTAPTAATLAAWDTYIAMMSADERDNERWNQSVYPPMAFDRACDDYAIAPGTEKLENLVALIKANPTFPQVGDWIDRTHKLMEDYRARRGGPTVTAENPPASPSPSTGAAAETVTSVQDGDETIITTHRISPSVTNSAPVTNAPPTP